MKVRDSGMPDETSWNSFFDIGLILSELHIDSQLENVVEIGSGYGTFSIPVSKIISGNLTAIDIESDMVDNLNRKLSVLQIDNIIVENRDVLVHTTGQKDNSIDYIMLFNILHHDSPLDFIDEAYRILKTGGKIGIIHWRSDITTPRGPDLSIRPKPEQIIDWFDKTKFQIDKHPFIIEPYHFGLIISKI